jgi:hypothetical protein
MVICDRSSGSKIGYTEQKKLPHQQLFSFVPRTRLELAHPCEHQPLKLACLPISPPGLLSMEHGAWGMSHLQLSALRYLVPRTGLEPAHHC